MFVDLGVESYCRTSDANELDCVVRRRLIKCVWACRAIVVVTFVLFVEDREVKQANRASDQV